VYSRKKFIVIYSFQIVNVFLLAKLLVLPLCLTDLKEWKIYIEIALIRTRIVLKILDFAKCLI
jgi:hypothetical protein